MNAEFHNNVEHPIDHDRRGRIFTGLAMIAFGAIWLLNEFFSFNTGHLVLPALAAIFLVWGIVTRSAGLLIPGGILGGVGTGVLLMNNLALEGAGHPGVFLLSLAAGFAAITLLSAVFTDETMWWALIPAGFIAVVGSGLLIGGPALEVLSFLGRYWPVVPIIIGLSLLFRKR